MNGVIHKYKIINKNDKLMNKYINTYKCVMHTQVNRWINMSNNQTIYNLQVINQIQEINTSHE